MTKPTTPRHSKKSKPVTIDLEAENVTRAEEGSDGKDEVSATAPQTPPSSDDRSAAPKGENPGKPEDAKRGSVDKSAASGLGAASATDVKRDAPKSQDARTGAGATAASGLAASQTGQAGKSSPGHDTSSFDGKPTTASAMGSASSAAAASAGAKSTSVPGTASASTTGDDTRASASSSGKTSGSSGGRSGGAFVGGVVGAALGVVALFGLQAVNMLPAPGGSSGGTETASLENEISTLRASLDDLRTSVAAVPGATDNSDITSRLDALEAGAGTTDAGSALSELSSRLDQISEKVDGLTGAAGGDAAGIREEIAGLSGRVDDMSGNVADLQTRLGALNGRIDGIEKGQSDLSASLGDRLAKAEQAIEDPGRELEMAKAIAVSGLKSAVDRGGSFAPELEAFASVAPDNPAIGRLREFAASGVPTQGELVERFPDAAKEMIAAMDPVSENAGILDRLAASAKSMVTVRKVGDVEGDSTEAIAARLEYQLKNGNLDAAVAEWDALPEKARDAAPAFGQGLKARAEVEKLLTDVQLPAVAQSQPEIAPAPADEAASPDATGETAPDAEAPAENTAGGSSGSGEMSGDMPAQSE
ncbi:hypothetical protein E2A64_00970 [Pseudohoeflea suaedae]|uniref:Phage tail protein n=1 Tax=Pseudohoeflea suaedae TaxID=877384 RepID=A0A4R5PMM1_9HYPH|nr:mitofilin family membrane protein [Pseudohoeflea suaedae]TDH37747.1 hypothetical protein E2A64_00970 [Pseudohoeflea suaedae]